MTQKPVVDFDIEVAGGATLAEVDQLGAGHAQERESLGVPVCAGSALQRRQQ